MTGTAAPLSILIPPTASFESVIECARLADELGYQSVNCSHIAARDSFSVLSAVAMLTKRVQLGTAVAPIYHRSPASMAQTAATVDDISDGRFALGLGIGHRATMGGWHGQDIGRPVVEMREYVAIVNAILDGRQPPQGQRWTSTFAFNGFTPRSRVPIYLAALAPKMLQLAGAVADGVLLWACTPDYIRNTVIPELKIGLAAAGKSLNGFAIMPVIPSAVGGDREAVLDGIRTEMHRYFSLPFYRNMFTLAGYAKDLAAYDQAPDKEAQKLVIPERLIDALCALGQPAEITASLDLYREAGATNPLLSHVVGTDFAATVRAAAPTNPR